MLTQPLPARMRICTCMHYPTTHVCERVWVYALHCTLCPRYLFPSGDVDALADAIVKIGGVSANEQAEMAQAGKEMVFAEHNKVKQFEKILEIIKEKARG